MQMEVLDRSADDVVRDLGSAELNWARFCIAPDKIEASKMPAMFPIPTHVVRRRLVKLVATNRVDRLIWSPEHLYGQGALLGLVPGLQAGSIGNTLSSQTERQQGSTSVQYQSGNWDVPLLQTFGAGINQSTAQTSMGANVVFDLTPRLSSSVAEGGVRLLGACMKIQYLGRMDDIQGLVQIAMNINGINQSYGTIPLSDAAFLTSDSIEQSPYYKSFRPSEGVRAIWFPIDESRFDFAQAHYAVDRTEWAPIRNRTTSELTTGAEATVETYVLPVGSSTDLTSGAALHYTGTSSALYGVGTPIHKLDNADHHARNRLEWQIQFQGTGTATFKVSIDQYYEVVPNETAQDDYNPQNSPQGDTDQAARVAFHMSKQIAVVSGHESEQPSFLRQAVSKIWDYGKTFVAPLTAAFAASKGMPNLAAGIMYGAGFGSNDNSSDARVLPYKRLKFS